MLSWALCYLFEHNPSHVLILSLTHSFHSQAFIFPTVLQLSVHSAAPPCIHLSKRTLHGAQEVSLFESIMVATDVMELKTEALHFLKIVVNCEDFGENWNDAAANHLCPIHLEQIRTWQMSHSNSVVLIYSFFFTIILVPISEYLCYFSKL